MVVDDKWAGRTSPMCLPVREPTWILRPLDKCLHKIKDRIDAEEDFGCISGHVGIHLHMQFP